MSKPLVAISGASSGIGEEAARAFSREGYPLLLMARRVERLEALSLPDCLCEKVDATLTSMKSAYESFRVLFACDKSAEEGRSVKVSEIQ